MEIRMYIRTKYNVNKNKENRTCNGIVFDSGLEMQYYRDVVLPKMESGEIVKCKLQKPFILQEEFRRNGKRVLPIRYIADFVLQYADGHEEIIDIKGYPDTNAILKRKLFWHRYPEKEYYWLTHSKKTGWIELDEYEKMRKAKAKAKKEQAKNEK